MQKNFCQIITHLNIKQVEIKWTLREHLLIIWFEYYRERKNPEKGLCINCKNKLFMSFSKSFLGPEWGISYQIKHYLTMQLQSTSVPHGSTNPKKALYNRVYNRTTKGCMLSFLFVFSIPLIIVALFRWYIWKRKLSRCRQFFFMPV